MSEGLSKRCGCPRRGWAKCRHPWHFAFKWGDTHHRFSLDKHLRRRVESKTEAEHEAEQIRIAIREGRFGVPAPRQEMTLQDLCDVYLERYVAVHRQATERAFEYATATLCRTLVPTASGATQAFGTWRLSDIVTDTIERFREVRRGEGVSVTGVNRNLQSLRALYNWAVRVGYVEHSPFKRHGEAIVKIPKADETIRTRRLDGDTDEEARLLAVCQPHLRAIVECALETGMRRGEILSLQWAQVSGLQVVDDGSTVQWAPKAEIILLAAKTKTHRDRRIPISSRLRALLEMRRWDPAGELLPDTAYVFGNAIGQQVGDVSRAWETAVLKANGHRPTQTRTGVLTADARAAFKAIDLHFHDLRREAGSRWLEGGVPLHVVRDWLGHTNIAQTSTYLAGTLKTQHDAMAAFEARRDAPAAPAARVQRMCNKSRNRGAKVAADGHREVQKPQ